MILGYFRVLEHEHTSTFGNVSLMKQAGNNPVWINTVDAKRLGIKDGDQVLISSPWEEVKARARVTWNIREGVLAAAGGYGGKYGLEGDPKYPQFSGFNTNVLLPPNVACKWSGTPPLKYIKSRISKI
jgi:thiosulfate reductase/polysulfide reductase chain A